MKPADLSEERVLEMISGVEAYLRRERELYFRASGPLTPRWRTAIEAYFSKTLIDRVKAVILQGARIPPPFYSEAMALSSGSFPDFVHLASITYMNTIVFHDEITLRTLFHRLVHAAQMDFLGLALYTEFHVRGIVKARSWNAIPLET
jgi:hypothetical protein